MGVARFAVVASLVAVSLCSLPTHASAQGTTATVRGTVRSADDRVPMAEVEVTLVDESTGSVKTAPTSADGSSAFNSLFNCNSLPVGGPYRVTATVNGFKSAGENNIFLTANRTGDVNLALPLQEEANRAARCGAAQSRGLGWSCPQCIVSER
jgi:hypothetical protein